MSDFSETLVGRNESVSQFGNKIKDVQSRTVGDNEDRFLEKMLDNIVLEPQNLDKIEFHKSGKYGKGEALEVTC